MATVPLPYDAAIDAPLDGHVATAWDSGPPVETGRFGTWVFLASEAFFFGGLLAAYFVLRGSSKAWVEPLSFGLGFTLTGLLVASSVCASISVRRLRAGARRSGSNWMLCASFLALAFLGVQAFEWRELAQEGFTPRGSLAGACFYILTGAHGLHVLAGVVWLAGSGVVLRSGAARTLHAELAALYQHFVDGIWLVLFTLLYLL
ncbi:MAG: cytochrome c oxidase subunit 3 [Planctomycetota bacterium]|nr:cytochrome c oxidase subunit 3 [Planctomycetota bacterium]